MLRDSVNIFHFKFNKTGVMVINFQRGVMLFIITKLKLVVFFYLLLICYSFLSEDKNKVASDTHSHMMYPYGNVLVQKSEIRFPRCTGRNRC